MSKILIRKETSQVLLRWVGTFLALGLFGFLFYQQDWKVIWMNFQSISLITFFFVWILFFLRIMINSFRWFILLDIAFIKISFLECVKIFLLGMFVSNFLPSTIGGDGIRVLALIKYKNKYSTALSTVLVDRIVNVVAMILLLPVPLIVFSDSISIRNSRIVLSVLLFSSTGDFIKRWLKKINNFLVDNKFWFSHPRKLLLSLLSSFSAQLIYFWGLWLIAVELGLDIRYIQVMAISVVAYIITLIPISINGYGVREVTITTLYSFLGFPIEAAISLAIITRLTYMLTTLPGGIWLPEYFSYIKVPD